MDTKTIVDAVLAVDVIDVNEIAAKMTADLQERRQRAEAKETATTQKEKELVISYFALIDKLVRLAFDNYVKVNGGNSIPYGTLEGLVMREVWDHFKKFDHRNWYSGPQKQAQKALEEVLDAGWDISLKDLRCSIWRSGWGSTGIRRPTPQCNISPKKA